MNQESTPSAPLSDAIIIAVSRLVDDAQSETRVPSHSDLEFQIKRAGLSSADPHTQGQVVGKSKRIRGTLSWALEHNPKAGEILVANLVSAIRASGGFRETSPNYVGGEAIANAVAAFRIEGYELTHDGELRPLILDNLSGNELSKALESYVKRAKRGSSDAALLTGTGKDLLEATAAHVLTERWQSYPTRSSFPFLLGQTFTALDLSTTQNPSQHGEPAQCRMERALYELGCAVNMLRNKEGTGHGRPWLPSVTDIQAMAAIESMGIIAEHLLSTHKEKP